MSEMTNSNAVATKVQCFAGRLQDFKDQEAGGAPLGAVEDVVIAVRFDELLEILAEGVVLSHQRHDTEAPGGEGDGGQ